MNQRIFPLLWALLAILVLGACASAPVPSDPPPEEERTEARNLRTRVERFGFAQAAPEENARAEAAFAAAESAYETDPSLSRASYLEASAGYRQVIRRGMQGFVVNYRQEIESNKARGQAVRAEVAQRELFEQAQANWDEAERLYEAEDLDQAADYFQRARDGFLQAQERATAQREEALEALRALDSGLDSAETEIRELEQEIQGGAE